MRTAIFRDIVDHLIRNWLKLHDDLKSEGEDIMDHMKEIAKFMPEDERKKFLLRFGFLLSRLIFYRQDKNGKIPRCKYMVNTTIKPAVRDSLITQIFAFLRDYCLFVIGHWSSKETPKGFEPTPKVG
jgi:hypothetical protein